MTCSSLTIARQDRSTIVDPDTPAEYWDILLRNPFEEQAAFRLEDDTVLGIPRRARLRRDASQILFYGSTNLDVWLARLNTAQCIVLSLFDGRRTLRQVAGALAELSGCSLTAADIKVRRFLAWLQVPADTMKFVTVTDDNRDNTWQVNAADYLIPEADIHIRARLDKPVSLLLMPTDRCWTDCVYCYACRRHIPENQLLSIERIHELIDEAADLGIAGINLDGGDLLRRKEHVDIISHICTRGIVPSVSTKGYVSRDNAKALYDAGLRWIQVGLDAPTPDAAAYTTGAKNYLPRAVETITNLVYAGITTRTNSIITKKTLPLLPDLVEFLMTFPLDNIKIAPAFRSMYRGGIDLLLSKEEKQWYRDVMMRMTAKYPDRGINWECQDDTLHISPEERKARFAGRAACSSGRMQIVITPDGKVNTCEQSPQGDEYICGDCKTQSIQEVWTSRDLVEWYQPEREQFEGTACFDCKDFTNCVWHHGHCWLYALRTYGTRFAPHPDCPRAPLPAEQWQ